MEQLNPGAKEEDNDTIDIESVVNRVKSGDKQAYAILIRKFEKKIYTYCYCILKSREEAEDALQEIFIKVYQDIDRYEERVTFSAWLYKIAYHHCLDQIRKQSRWQRLVSLYQEQQTPFYDNYNKQVGIEQAVHELLMPLNREEKNILLLKVVEQYSFEEIGQIMDCKPATLRKKYERLRKKLHQQKMYKGGMASGEIAKSN
ncbi:RNA polymerase sigma factor [Aneurinibacillus migulanus]|uniref:RNA polymerase sigma-70 factor, ECF subfamily n=1 Tax=Aneurinibacillus migulanus TaxID=47500 RepID=A0A1G8VDA8_ANEMI|nr:RNA polymerase sigma factor [Aneurinibacillus migulanus]KIV57813.1 DNA-directed RNA polymerase subunit sigma [Aneurinibacillus migulanus]MED0896041.1 RNA polymerase sigma factor [Aneurinibacillus migulanus]MED1618523.1 RNA polymerase sigma factor [Aneurinibacillus migulanus]SDJ64092.1 RNA polymerase sigma-70 factor, ECF subfamily [Aneurinibacillus migulanus]GED15660.1 RNA polymerase sigma factor [Aneurinibacillus migulanus]